MVMVMSTAGRRGKWKASRGSFMEQSIVHLFLSILLSSFLLSSFFNTWDDGRWQLLYICPFLFTSFLFDCGLASRENEPPFFNLREISIFLAASYYFFFSITALFCLLASPLAFVIPWVSCACLKSPILISTFSIISLACMVGRMIVQSWQLKYSNQFSHYRSKDVQLGVFKTVF